MVTEQRGVFVAVCGGEGGEVRFFCLLTGCGGEVCGCRAVGRVSVCLHGVGEHLHLLTGEGG